MVESKEHPVDDFVAGSGIEFVDGHNKPIEGLRFKLELSDGTTQDGETKSDGIILLPQDQDGDTKITLVLGNPEDDSKADNNADE